jgi:hypothetical protein
MVWLIPSSRVHSLMYSATAIIIGFQIVTFAIFTKVFAVSEGLLPRGHRLIPQEKIAINKVFRYTKLELGLIAGGLLLLFGTVGTVYVFEAWEKNLFGSLDPINMMRVVIPSVTSLALGFQIIFSSFFLSVLDLKRR